MKLWLGSLALLLVLGCDKPAPPPPAASASATPVASAPPPPAPSAKPAQRSATAGKWSGSYQAQHYQIEAPKGEGAREWAGDDGGAHAGSGSISLVVAEDGEIRGNAAGALGEHNLVGEVDGETFRIRFAPKQPGDRAFGGFTILTREGSVMKGRLQASSGDSKTVRDALISVSRGEADAAD